jgi:hypothetical protein
MLFVPVACCYELVSKERPVWPVNVASVAIKGTNKFAPPSPRSSFIFVNTCELQTVHKQDKTSRDVTGSPNT